MKKLIKLAAVVAAMGLALAFVACDGNITNEESSSDSSGSSGSSGSKLSLLIGNVYTLDLTDFSLDSSTPAQLLTADQLSGAEEVVFVVTYNSGSSWVTIYSDTSWSNDVSLGTWGTADTYTYTLSDFTNYTDGIYIAGSDGSLDAVLVLYSE